jgi:glutaredoxin 3
MMTRYFIYLTLVFSLIVPALHAAVPPPSSKQSPVVIYTIPGCMGCGMAKSMFEDKNIPYTEIDVNRNAARYNEMVAKAGGQPGDQMGVPKIFINGKFIGGYMDVTSEQLNALEGQFSPKKTADHSEVLPGGNTAKENAGG